MSNGGGWEPKKKYATSGISSKGQSPSHITATDYTADEKNKEVETALTASQAAEGTVRPESKVLAAQQTKSAVTDLNSAQGSAVLLENPTQRKIQDGELISGAANAETASKFTEQVQAATALPSE